MADQAVNRLTERLEVAIEERILDTPVDVLVLGPDISGTELTSAARLRYEIWNRCRDFGASVKGEHSRLIAAAKKHFGDGYNLCTYEIMLAKTVDLVVIVPESAGSIAELGLIALINDVGPKTLVLFSKHRRYQKSYIMDGPRKSLEFRRAKIEFVDYEDVDSSWKIVRGAIQKTRILKIDRTL